MINWSHQEEGFCERSEERRVGKECRLLELATQKVIFSMMKMNMAMSSASALKVLI